MKRQCDNTMTLYLETAIRSGDYYMFNTNEDNIGMIDDEEEKDDEEDVANKRHSSGVTISEVIARKL